MSLHTLKPFLLLSPFLFAGCGEELGPERLPTTSVDGRVQFRGRPIGPGWVEFAPVDGAVGLVSSARLQADGTFHAARVPVGMVGMRLAGVRLPDAGDPSINRYLFLTTQANLIHRRVDASRTNAIDVDLAVEAARSSRELPR